MQKPTHPRDERILAIDFGTRRIGLAAGNTSLGVAVSIQTLTLPPRNSFEEGLRLVAERAVAEAATGLVVGMPLNMDGTEGRMARKARAFGEALSRASGLPLVFWDERLTSEAAREAVREAGRRGRARKAIDDLAAAILLQSWIDDQRAREARERLADGRSQD